MTEVKEVLRSVQDQFRPNEIIVVVEASPEGGYEAQALGFAIFTQADTMDKLKAMAQDAVRCHFDESSRPRVIRLHLVKDEVIPV